VNNRIEQLRAARNLTQQELADILDVSRQTVSSLENGRYNPSLILAFRIAQYFQLSIEDIFEWQDSEEEQI
jgi:putative transcriptional regulator